MGLPDDVDTGEFGDDVIVIIGDLAPDEAEDGDEIEDGEDGIETGETGVGEGGELRTGDETSTTGDFTIGVEFLFLNLFTIFTIIFSGIILFMIYLYSSFLTRRL